MSNFFCEHCDTEIIENDKGEYITHCKHYPKETMNTDNRERCPVAEWFEGLEDAPLSENEHYND